jgi:hypothetical protein
MLLTDMNDEDLDLLQQFRLERLLGFFTSSLPYCLTQIDERNMLTIYCPSSGIVDELLDAFDELCAHARLVLGVKTIGLYFAQEEILRTDTYVSIGSEK